MSKKRLIVTAHPDDESIFFSGLIQKVGGDNFSVICVTDGNADGKGSSRLKQFLASMKRLGVTDCQTLAFPDIYEKRLDIEKLSDILLANHADQSFKEVYTHGVLGEYGHPHHQDVSYAVHMTFNNKCPVWSIAYNCYPDKEFKLNEEQFKVKTEILSKIYLAETKRFVHFLQSYWYEGFTKVSLEEVTVLYEYISKGIKPDLKKLKVYSWYWTYLENNKGKVGPRPF